MYVHCNACVCKYEGVTSICTCVYSHMSLHVYSAVPGVMSVEEILLQL